MRIGDKIVIFFLAAIVVAPAFTSAALGQNRKYDLWRNPSFFRGFNVLAIVDNSREDYEALRAAGANYCHLNVRGFREPEAPYETNPELIAECDSAVARCRAAGLYYSLTVRRGPGRSDVWREDVGLSPNSTIWTNPEEQKLYASTISDMVSRYLGDTLFVAISPILEPNPLFDEIYFSAKQLKSMCEEDGIDVAALLDLIADSVRSVDPYIPIIFQNFAYSNPDFFSEFRPSDDPYPIYEFHCYRPLGYPTENEPKSQRYPGHFLHVGDNSYRFINKDFIDKEILKYINSLQTRTRKPIIMGEFGLQFEQHGGPILLKDLTDICVERGRHFAYWVWRGKSSTGSWDYEAKSEDYMLAVEESFEKTQIYETFDKNSLAVYPTVASDYVFLEATSRTPGKLSVFDATGKRIADVTNELNFYAPGDVSTVRFECSGLAPGVYFARFVADGKVLSEPFFTMK